MKNISRPGCVCGDRTPRPPRPDPPRCPSPGILPGGFLMQRICAAGRVHLRRACETISLEGLPASAPAPYTVVDACAGAPDPWEETACRGQRLLRVNIPLRLRVRDGLGQLYCVSSSIARELPLRYECPPLECWNTQPYVQAAVRLAGRCCPCEGSLCEIPLEICMEGYLVCSCVWGGGGGCERAPERPWYPEPIQYPCSCR